MLAAVLRIAVNNMAFARNSEAYLSFSTPDDKITSKEEVSFITGSWDGITAKVIIPEENRNKVFKISLSPNGVPSIGILECNNAILTSSQPVTCGPLSASIKNLTLTDMDKKK